MTYVRACGQRPFVNLARRLIETNGQTLNDWDGACFHLADLVIEWGGNLLWVECLNEGRCLPQDWSYHAVPLVNGWVHDAWCPESPCPIDTWLRTMFPDIDVRVEIDSQVVYEGLSNAFPYHLARWGEEEPFELTLSPSQADFA